MKSGTDWLSPAMIKSVILPALSLSFGIKYPIGFVSNFVSCNFESFWTKVNFFGSIFEISSIFIVLSSSHTDSWIEFGILDGTKDFKGLNQQSYDYYNAIPGAITKVYRSYEVTDSGRTNTL